MPKFAFLTEKNFIRTRSILPHVHTFGRSVVGSGGASYRQKLPTFSAFLPSSAHKETLCAFFQSEKAETFCPFSGNGKSVTLRKNSEALQFSGNSLTLAHPAELQDKRKLKSKTSLHIPHETRSKREKGRTGHVGGLPAERLRGNPLTIPEDIGYQGFNFLIP